jgi:SAM-dependent methyltransferase
LPFPDRSFDVALMVHVLHVIADWKHALLEVRRVVQPDSLLLHVWNNRQQDDIASRLTERFRVIVEAGGGSVARPGAPRREDAVAFWAEQGWHSEEIEVARWQEDFTPAGHIQLLRDRVWSGTWQLSDELLASAVDQLTLWAQAELGPLEQSYPIERGMMIDCVRFTAS